MVMQHMSTETQGVTVIDKASGRIEWGAGVGSAWSRVPEKGIIALVHSAAVRDPEAIALTFENGLEVTRKELADRVEQFAGFLSEKIQPGDRVAIVLGNRAEFMVAWLGTIAARGVAVLVNPGVQTQDGVHILRDSRAVIAVVTSSATVAFAAIRAECPGLSMVLEVEVAEPDGLASYAGKEPVKLADFRSCPSTEVTVSYTSGTTGLPKACVLTNRLWLRYVDVNLRTADWGQAPVALCCLEMAYGDPLWIFLTALQANGSMVVMRKFSVSRFWQVVRNHQVSVIVGIGAIPNLLLTADPHPLEKEHSVKFGIQVAIPTQSHLQLVERFGFPWLDVFGLTESGPAVGVPIDIADDVVGSGTMGIPFPEVDAEIVDDRGDPIVGPGTGELILRCPGMFAGYENRAEATAEMLQGGWLHTGDVVERDARGLYYHLRRNKDVIRRSGSNIAPAEVEEVLRQHPDIAQAAVVPVEDDLRGQEAKAYVQLKSATADFDPRKLVDFCAERLLDYKVPRYIEVRTEDFPMTLSMRIPKAQLMVGGRHRTEAAWDREA